MRMLIVFARDLILKFNQSSERKRKTAPGPSQKQTGSYDHVWPM